MKNSNKKAFTLIEMLVVLAIIGILAALSVPYSISYLNGVKHSKSLDQTISLMRKAQSYAMNDKSGGPWGICLSNGQIKLYGGSCNAPTYQNVYTIPGNTEITGLSDIEFENNTGNPDSETTILIHTGRFKNTITINNVGGMAVVNN